ncbi:unnamed protein product [Effrenium voratum]|uniref:Uncharacterized protein n=1 Tax=Effrenium voratum TaxID=2562239 RepID=A0AA36MR14_9DINO|nr:unnamed protein product [Effrenium voratum]
MTSSSRGRRRQRLAAAVALAAGVESQAWLCGRASPGHPRGPVSPLRPCARAALEPVAVNGLLVALPTLGAAAVASWFWVHPPKAFGQGRRKT